MPSVFLPTKFVNEMIYDDTLEGKLIRRKRTVESTTGSISVDYSGSLSTSFSPEALKDKKRLEIKPGETLECSEDEAKFLIERYPFLQLKEGTLGGISESVIVEVVRDLTPISAPVASDPMEGAPANFMEFKKWAGEKGVSVIPTDKKDDIVRKLQAL